MKHIFDPIFTQNYYYFNNNTYESYKKSVLKKFNVKLLDKNEVTGCFNVIERNGGKFCLVWAKSGEIRYIVHEAFHAVSYSLRRRGLELSDDSEETFAYALQFLVKEILSNKPDKRIVIRQ